MQRFFPRSLRKQTTMFKRDDTLKLGDVAKDSITGFTGVIVCISEWLNGCRRLSLQPQQLDDGKMLEAHTFDAEQIVRVEAGVDTPPEPHGGPSIAPVRQADPSR